MNEETADHARAEALLHRVEELEKRQEQAEAREQRRMHTAIATLGAVLLSVLGFIAAKYDAAISSISPGR